ncbi:hypothetical protein HKX48_006313 [Thoreauomyces humboldtii]|nr:hypothetical protein HKX48_006313 [Thoreauomyces humboldtii]
MLPTIKHAFAVVGLCLTAVTGATTASTNVTVKPWDLWPRPTNCTDVSNLLSVIGYGTGDEVPFIGMICTRALPLKAVGPSSDYYKERGPDYGQFVYARIPTSEGFVPATDCLLDLGYDACKTQCDATGDIIGEYSCFTQNTPVG